MAGMENRDEMESRIRDEMRRDRASAVEAGRRGGQLLTAVAMSGDYDVDMVEFRRAGLVLRPNEERLEYYRTHGLVRCDDYPGGDAQFEADVLSGAFYDKYGEMEEPPREDAYIIVQIENGKFKPDTRFFLYGYNQQVMAAFNKWRNRDLLINRHIKG